MARASVRRSGPCWRRLCTRPGPQAARRRPSDAFPRRPPCAKISGTCPGHPAHGRHRDRSGQSGGVPARRSLAVRATEPASEQEEDGATASEWRTARGRHVPRTCALPLHAAAELQAQRWSRWVLAAGRPRAARRPKPPSCFECRSTHTSELLRKCHTRISAEFGIRHAACHGK